MMHRSYSIIHEHLSNADDEEFTEAQEGDEMVMEGTVKGNGSGVENKSVNINIKSCSVNELDTSDYERLGILAEEINEVLKKVEPQPADTILLSTAEGRGILSQKLDEAEVALKELAPDIDEAITEDEDDTLLSAVEEQDEDEIQLLSPGTLSRSRSGSVKDIINEFELRCESLTSQDVDKTQQDNANNNSWAEEMDSEFKARELARELEEEFMAETPKRKRTSNMAEFSSPEEVEFLGSTSGNSSPDLFDTVKRAKTKIKRQRHIISMYAKLANKNISP